MVIMLNDIDINVGKYALIKSANAYTFFDTVVTCYADICC